MRRTEAVLKENGRLWLLFYVGKKVDFVGKNLPKILDFQLIEKKIQMSSETMIMISVFDRVE